MIFSYTRLESQCVTMMSSTATAIMSNSRTLSSTAQGQLSSLLFPAIHRTWSLLFCMFRRVLFGKILLKRQYILTTWHPWRISNIGKASKTRMKTGVTADCDKIELELNKLNNLNSILSRSAVTPVFPNSENSSQNEPLLTTHLYKDSDVWWGFSDALLIRVMWRNSNEV